MSGRPQQQRLQAPQEPQRVPVQGRVHYTSYVRRRRNRRYGIIAALLLLLAVVVGIVVTLLVGWLPT
jgi:membrane protein YqaA with SNARE-associated domain